MTDMTMTTEKRTGMYLIQEDLARAHTAGRLAEADHERLLAAVRAKRRAQRAALRAERAAMRARRMLALAVSR